MWLLAVAVPILVIGSAIEAFVLGIGILRRGLRTIDQPFICCRNTLPMSILGIALLIVGIVVTFVVKWYFGFVAIALSCFGTGIVSCLYARWVVQRLEQKVGHKLPLRNSEKE